MLVKLAWKNIWRNPNRTLITMAAIFFAVMLSVITSSLREGIFDNLVKNVVSFYSGYIQVHQQGYYNEQILDNSFQANDAIEQKIYSNENISGIAPRLESFALASVREVTKGCLVVGILPDKEDSITALKSKLTGGTFLQLNDRGVLMAEGLAKALKLRVDDTVALIAQGYHGAMAAGKFKIQGIAQFGSPELNDKALFMTLARAQEFYTAEGLVTAYILMLKNVKQMSSVKNQLSASLGDAFEVMTWGEMMPDIQQHIQTDTSNAKYVQGILYMLICFGIFGTLLMMMEERAFEMGMLVAIGMKKSKLILLLIIESVITVLAGCIVGIGISVPVVYYLERYPLRISGETAQVYQRFGFEPIFLTAVDASIFIRQGLIVLMIGLILSLYPAYKALRLNPVEAMKK